MDRSRAEEYPEKEDGKVTAADFYLENMPVAFCAVEILTSGNGDPVDYKYIYHNKAYARLAGKPYGALNGKRGLAVRGKIERELLLCCYDAAFHGTSHTLKDYSPDQERHFLIYIYPLRRGSCGCVLQDVTENRRMEQELLREHEKRKSFLKATTEIDFEYDFATNTLTFGAGDGIGGKSRVISGGLEGLIRSGVIREQDKERIEDAFEELRRGKRAVEFHIQACLDGHDVYRWYAVSSSAYKEQQTGRLRVVGYFRNAERLIRDQAALKKEAMYDPLVELYNVKTGRALVREALEKLKEQENAVMFLIDIDNFKRINDTYGHLKGDEVLKQFALTLKSVFRKSDIVYRMGGDEFIGFAGNSSQPELAAERIMERLYGRLREQQERGIQIQCSAGIFIGSKKSSYSDFYSMADRALYAAKRSGKNKYQIIKEKDYGQHDGI